MSRDIDSYQEITDFARVKEMAGTMTTIVKKLEEMDAQAKKINSRGALRVEVTDYDDVKTMIKKFTPSPTSGPRPQVARLE